MKIKAILLPLLMLLAFIGNAQKTVKKGYVIKGKLDGMGVSQQYVYLSSIVIKQGLHTDSVKLNNGAFTFKGTVDEPCMTFIYTKIPGQKYPAVIDVFLENSDITVQATMDPTVHKYMKDVKVEGSAVHKEYEFFANDAIERSGRAKIYKEYKAAEKRKDTAQMTAWSKANMEAMDAYMKYQKEWLASHPNSFVTLNFMSSTVPEDEAGLNKLEAQLDGLLPKIRTSFAAKQIYEKITEERRRSKIGPGAMAADFTQPGIDGKPVKLSDYRGKYVFVDFWASWCIPCRHENPNVLKAYNEFHAKGLEILAVSLDNKREAWLKAIEQDKLPWKQVSDLKGPDNAAGMEYLIKTIPANFLIDPNGKIVASGLRGESLHIELQKIFGN